MKRFFLITVLVFSIWSCNRPPEQIHTGENVDDGTKLNKQDITSTQNQKTADQKEDTQNKKEPPPPEFLDEDISRKKVEAASGDSDKNAGEILIEVEKLLCDGDCTSYSMPPVNLSKLNEDISAALRNEGLDRITVEINNRLEATLKGAVVSENDKNRAFEITAKFKDITQIKDMIFIVESEEMRL